MPVQSVQRNLTTPADNRFSECVELKQGVEEKGELQVLNLYRQLLGGVTTVNNTTDVCLIMMFYYKLKKTTCFGQQWQSSGFIRNYMLTKTVFIQCASPRIDVEISPSTCRVTFFFSFFLYGLGVDSGSRWSGPVDSVVELLKKKKFARHVDDEISTSTRGGKHCINTVFLNI